MVRKKTKILLSGILISVLTLTSCGESSTSETASATTGEDRFFYEDGVSQLSSVEMASDFTLRITAENTLDLAQLQSAEIHQEDSHFLVAEVLEAGENQYNITLESQEIDFSKVLYFTMEGMKPMEVQYQQSVFKTQEFLDSTTYTGELGAVYSKEETIIRLWTPFASEVILHTYEAGFGENLLESYPMTKMEQGFFEVVLSGDCHGVYYDFSVTNNGKTEKVHDPYAKASGVNSIRSMVVDLPQTDPENWENDSYIHSKEAQIPQTDAIIYELHVRDMSMDPEGNMEHQGKFLAFTEDSKTDSGVATGLAHIKELGVNYIHLLPIYDYNSVDETQSDGFNWGYDPVNYNVPEGSYATDPYDGTVRIREMKEMVQSIHDQGIGVVMDVVYNHTAKSADSHFNLIAPNYYYRLDDQGNFSNGSGCGNEIASDHEMVRRYIIDSVCYWAEEYHIDGFRFDLMGVLDIETMNEIRREVDKINPNIILYGEGWSGGSVATDYETLAMKDHTFSLDERIACFSDDVRDGIKGDVFIAETPGYVNSEGKSKLKVMFGITASTQDVNAIKAWAKEPTQVVTYVSAHDNYTLYDKIQMSAPQGTSEADMIAMNNLAAAITLTSQGISFIHAGEELLRSKPLPEGGFDENSYSSSDAVNMLRWENKTTYASVFDYYQGLIALRNTHPEFRYSTTAEISENLQFVTTEDSCIYYTLADKFVVIFNPYPEGREFSLPAGNYQYYVNKTKAQAEGFGETLSASLSVAPLSAVVLGKI